MVGTTAEPATKPKQDEELDPSFQKHIPLDKIRKMEKELLAQKNDVDERLSTLEGLQQQQKELELRLKTVQRLKELEIQRQKVLYNPDVKVVVTKLAGGSAPDEDTEQRDATEQDAKSATEEDEDDYEWDNYD